MTTLVTASNPATTPAPAPAPRRRTVAAALAATNLALLGVVGYLALSPRVADAQATQPPQPRAPGEYTMVAGQLASGTSAAVYVVDSVNQEVLTLRWDPSRQTLAVLGYRDLKADAAARPSR
jgi:hypothetical protein